MKRREMTMVFGALACTGVAGRFVHAQQPQVVPVELEDYVQLERPLEVSLPPGKKIELVEFFWYECPHCNAFQPLLVDWMRTLPADVALRYVPVGFTPRHEAAQRMFCALQVMGLAEDLHAKIYDAIHLRNRRIDFEYQMVSLVSGLGGDGARFREVVRSPEVASLARRATQLADAYGVDGVPTLGIQGRFRTSPAMTGGRERALRVAEVLIERCRAVT
jgi:protein dithiol oxidoreductase (disulfide-forming)